MPRVVHYCNAMRCRSIRLNNNSNFRGVSDRSTPISRQSRGEAKSPLGFYNLVLGLLALHE